MTYLACPDAPAATKYATVHIAWELSKSACVEVRLEAWSDCSGHSEVEPLRDRGRRTGGNQRQARLDPRQGGQDRLCQ